VIGLTLAPYRSLLAAAVAVLLVSGGWVLRDIGADKETAALKLQIAQIQQAHAQQSADAAARLQQAEAANRSTEAKHQAALEEIARVKRTVEAVKIQAAAARAAVAARSLRDAAKAATDALVSSATSAAPVAERIESATETGMVLSDVLGSCGARVADLARLFEQSRSGHAACEASYDAVRAPPPPPPPPP